MITPQQLMSLQVKPKWQLPVGVMEGIVAYNCRKHGFTRPVLAMPMWEAAGNRAMDLSGRGNHGDVVGANWVSNGLDYNGSDDRVDIGQLVGQITGANPRTIYISFVADVFGVDTEECIMVYAGGSAGGGWWVFAEDQAVSVGFAGHRLITPKTALSTGVQYTAALVVPDGATHTADVLIYIDGVNQSLSDEAGSSQTLTTSTTNVKIGSDEAPANYFNGRITHICIFDEGHSASQIEFIHTDPYFMYRIPEELYSYVAAAAGVSVPVFLHLYNQMRQ